MTKPHTTLSEAVRALELPEPAGTLQYVRPLGRPGYLKAYTADQVRALLESVAKLVEQHEAQEPVGTVVEMPGSGGGFTMCAFKAKDVPIGTKLYAK